jgi:peroxiredoxin
MRNSKILILFLLIYSLAFIDKLNAQKGFTISMDLTGFRDGDKFYLLDLDLGQIIDSASLKNGKAHFSGTVKEPAGFRIHTIENKYLIIEIENCDIRVKGSFKDFAYCSIEGSELNKVWTKSRDFQRTLQTDRDSLMQKLMKIMDTNPDMEKEIVSKVKKIDSIVFQYRLSLIKKESPTFFTIKELYYLRNDLPTDTLKELFNIFPTSLQKTKYGDVIQTYIDSKKAPRIGDKFIEISGTDIHGNLYKLSDTKGKYVLLEFWASWCGPCLSEIPIMTKAYATFKDKGFEIFSFSIDANKDDWKKSVEKNNVTWKNVTDSKGLYSIMAAKYGVRAIPKNFLISPDGIIVAIDLRGDQLGNKLKEIFN